MTSFTSTKTGKLAPRMQRFSISTILAAGVLCLAGNPTALAGETVIAGQVTTVELEGENREATLARLSNNLDLQTAMFLAFQNNFQVRQAQQRVFRQTQLVREARGALLPAISGTGNWSRMEESLLPTRQGQRTGDVEDWGTALELSQTIYAGGSDWAQLKAQMQLLAAARAELHGLINEIALGVKQRFYDAQLALAQIGVQEDLIRLREAELSNAQNRLAAGVGSNFEALRARVALANSRPGLIRTRNSYELNLQELRRYIGLELLGRDGLTLAGRLTEESFGISEDEALTRAHLQRPEIAQRLLTIDAQKSVVRATRGQQLPRVEAFTNYQVNRAPDEAEEDVLHGAMVGVRSTWNIWDGGQTTARVRQAQTDVRVAELQLEELRFGIEVEVRRSYIELVNARELVKASEQVITEAEESLRLAQSRLEVGAATQLDILDTQVALTEARTNRVQALRDLNVAIATLETAIGEGVEPGFVLPAVAP